MHVERSVRESLPAVNGKCVWRGSPRIRFEHYHRIVPSRSSSIARLLRTLRNRRTGTATFRDAAHKFAPLLIARLRRTLKQHGVPEDSLLLVVVLRAAVALLPAALRAFPDTPVAVAGLKRDDRTAVASWYYENFPRSMELHAVVILDPMLATGGSAQEVVQKLLALGADPRRIYFVGVLAAPQGLRRLTRLIPEGNIVLMHVDRGLDARKFIVPGLGDFGDRYFGYAP